MKNINSLIKKQIRILTLKVLSKAQQPTWLFLDHDFFLFKKLGKKGCAKLFKLDRKYRSLILNESDPKKRAKLYTLAYEEIFIFLSERIADRELFSFSKKLIVRFKNEFLNKKVIDYGCGNGLSTSFISKYADTVYGVDCNRIALKIARKKYIHLKKMHFYHISDGTLPFKDKSIDTVYSSDLIEHLHPKDAFTHLNEVNRVLKRNGSYIIWTPGKTNGPHDITCVYYPKNQGFPTLGLHLKEYSFHDILKLAQETNFRKIFFPDLNQETLAILKK